MNLKLGKRYKRKDQAKAKQKRLDSCIYNGNQTEFDKLYRDAWQAQKKHWEEGLRREINNEYHFNRVAWESNHTNENSTFHLTDLQ